MERLTFVCLGALEAFNGGVPADEALHEAARYLLGCTDFWRPGDAGSGSGL